MREIVAVILAGGSGTRNWPIDTNKVIFPFLNSTLVECAVLKNLPKQISRIVIVCSKENIEYLSTIKFSVPSACILQSDERGMAGAIVSAKTYLKNVSLIIINGDDIYDGKLLEKIINRYEQNSDIFGIIPGWESSVNRPLGYLQVQGEKIEKIVEKPSIGNEPSKYVNLVGHFIKDSDTLLSAIDAFTGECDDIYEKVLSELMKKYLFVMEKYEGIFLSLKYPWNILEISDHFLHTIQGQTIGTNVQISNHVVINGPVIIQDDVKIFEFTKITGPCFIGKGTIIGNHNIIRSSHIGTNCVTGYGSDITRSYIGNDCWFHTNYIGDSVLENNISLGSGSVLSNVRLDDGIIFSMIKNNRISTMRTKLGAIIGSGVRIGSNTTVMPGIKIGKNSAIGAGIVVNKDVAESTLCYASVKLVEKQYTKTVSTESRSQLKQQL